jgi:hypothetical protein
MSILPWFVYDLPFQVILFKSRFMKKRKKYKQSRRNLKNNVYYIKQPLLLLEAVMFFLIDF